MNILFLTLLKIDNLQTKGIYHDLMNTFADNGHHLYIVSPTERRDNKPTALSVEGNVQFLNVRTLNIQKTNIVEKGLATVSVEYLFLRAVKKYFKDVKFDLVLYSTPPITFTKVIDFVKKRDGAQSYLLLKDIFPQNAVDMKMMKKGSLIYNFFHAKEKKLYQISDSIGCMSEANRNYIIKHNPELDRSKIEVNPNSINPLPFREIAELEKSSIKKKFGIPHDKKVFIYGGNLGVPQGLDFLLETILASKDFDEAFFLVVGSGTEFDRISAWFDKNKPENAILLSGLPKQEYDTLLKACDVGMIFLHRDFTIPNFPSRLLSYLEFKLPVLVAADTNTDIGTEVEKNKCGISVEAGNLPQMVEAIRYFVNADNTQIKEYKENARHFLEREFLTDYSYKKIMKRMGKQDD